jgi:hypothetical protein
MDSHGAMDSRPIPRELEPTRRSEAKQGRSDPIDADDGAARAIERPAALDHGSDQQERRRRPGRNGRRMLQNGV